MPERRMRPLRRLITGPSQLFFHTYEFATDEFRASATALSQSDDLEALNWLSPEQLINVYDRTRHSDRLEVTTGLCDRVASAVGRRLMVGLQCYDPETSLQRIIAEFGPDCIPVAPYYSHL